MISRLAKGNTEGITHRFCFFFSPAVERGDSGILSQHKDAASWMQVGPAHRPEHAGGAFQPPTDARLLRPGTQIRWKSQRLLISDLRTPPPPHPPLLRLPCLTSFLRLSGLQHGQADLGALHRVLVSAVGEQCQRHFPRGHAGVHQQEQQKCQTQQSRPWQQEDFTHARQARPGRRGLGPPKGQSQKLLGYVTDEAKDEDRVQVKQEATGQHSFLHA